MSPERWRRIEELYSAGLQKSVGDRAAFLGVTVSEMLTGELPFSGHSDFELASAILSGPARKLPPHIHPRIGEIVRCCLSGDASLRFQSATELHHALVSYQRQADDGPTKRISWLHQLRSGRSPGWSRLTVLCTLLVCLSALFGWQQLRPTARTAAGCDAITLISQAHVAVLPTQLIGTATSEPHLGIVIPDMITTRLAASERHGPASIGPPVWRRLRDAASRLRGHAAPVLSCAGAQGQPRRCRLSTSAVPSNSDRSARAVSS